MKKFAEMRCDELRLQISPDRIYFLKFILEAYDNLGLLSTIDQQSGTVLVRYPSCLAGEIKELLASLAQQLQTPRPFSDPV